MLYSLCMKFQAELVNFQDQLENRVLCKTFPSRQNSKVHPSVATHEELKNVFESYNRGVPRIWQGGSKEFFLQIWKFACREATCCAWLAMRFARGVWGHAPRENFFKWCNLVRFGVYFDKILSLKFLKNYHFLYKKI